MCVYVSLLFNSACTFVCWICNIPHRYLSTTSKETLMFHIMIHLQYMCVCAALAAGSMDPPWSSPGSWQQSCIVGASVLSGFGFITPCCLGGRTVRVASVSFFVFFWNLCWSVQCKVQKLFELKRLETTNSHLCHCKGGFLQVLCFEWMTP